MLISKNFLTREASYKPSYLTSWIQSGPLGTALPEVGKQNSIGMAAFSTDLPECESVVVPDVHRLVGGRALLRRGAGLQGLSRPPCTPSSPRAFARRNGGGARKIRVLAVIYLDPECCPLAHQGQARNL